MDKFSWKNKFLTLMCATLLAGTSAARDQGRLDLQTITSGELAPAYITGINPIAGTDLYAQVIDDFTQLCIIRKPTIPFFKIRCICMFPWTWS